VGLRPASSGGLRKGRKVRQVALVDLVSYCSHAWARISSAAHATLGRPVCGMSPGERTILGSSETARQLARSRLPSVGFVARFS
jgi:hypothetical protein